MGSLLVVLAMGGLGLLLLGGKAGNGGAYAQAFNRLADGQLAFKPAVRDVVVNQLLIKSIAMNPNEPHTATLTQLGHLAPLAQSAYAAIRLLWEQGLEIWVPQTYWLPIKEGSQAMVWFDTTRPPKKLGYALLIGPNDNWPPMPTDMPAVPVDVPPIPTV